MDRIPNPIVLHYCRRFIHCDKDAEEVAGDFQKQGGPVENMGQRIYDYLVELWDPIPDWDDPAFIEVVKAVVDPTAPEVSGFEAARTAYNRLESPEQALLKFKVIGGVSEEGIAQILWAPVDEVRRNVESAKKTFWQRFTSERWSTLLYFLEEICEEVDSPSSEILKREKEYLTAKAAYNALDQTAKDALKLRHLEGLSVSEIAAKRGVSLVEISGLLTQARGKFYGQFLGTLYGLLVRGVCIVETDEGGTPKIEVVETKKIKVGPEGEDHVSEAWVKLQEAYYKIVPKNFRGWVTTSAKREEQDSERTEWRHNQFIRKIGRIDMNPDGERVPVLGTDAEPLQPDEELEKEESEKEESRFWADEAKRWHELLTKTTESILGTKKVEKKLYLLVHYIFQPKLNELTGTKARISHDHEFQSPGEAMAVAHVLDQYQSKATQAEIGDVIDATDRSIRRYADELVLLVKRYAKQVGIEEAELVEGCAPIKESDVNKRRG